ncbi:MAG: hypothetical protein QM784_01315 [Polyangiaceae bacterium]
MLTTRDFELRDWLAFGSGCNARASQRGDVDILVTEEPPESGRYRVRLGLDRWGIGTSDVFSKDSEAFARECAIRLAIQPTSGHRLSAVESVPTYRVDKAAGARIRLRARLFVAGESDYKFEKWIESSEVLRERLEPVQWRRESPTNATFRAVPCGQSSLVGLKLSAAVFRETLSPYDVTVALQGGATEIVLEFATCG